jgi:hypothetical protein
MTSPFRAMRRILNQAGNAAVKRKRSIFEIVYRRLVRLGHNKTIGVIAHRLRHLIWIILHNGVRYEERGPAVSEKSRQRHTARMIRMLRILGYRVEPLGNPAEPTRSSTQSIVGEKHSSRRARECVHFNCARSRLTAMPLGDGSCSRRTNHPVVASGSEEPSHKIELVFSATPETVVGASGVRTPSLNRPSAGLGSLHAV